MQARWYQSQLTDTAQAMWSNGVRNVLGVLPTGAGKSFCMARVAATTPGAIVVIAHRSELVSQISLAMAREGLRHNIIGPASLQRLCTSFHEYEFKRPYFDANARVAVASVDTLVRMPRATPWFTQVQMWMQDEAHHLLAANKWGRAAALFPNAKGFGVTATPLRADGRGLGRHADGLIDAMVVGPSMRDLIDTGFLTDYRVFAPRSDIDLSSVTTSANGDYSPPKLAAARRASHITGDVVAHYLRIAPGKRGITFDVDIASATETAAAFKAAGVRAEVVTSDTPTDLRAALGRRFAAGDIQQLVNVDLFGEGYDLPALEVVSMARPTQSYGLFCQQFGRALRPLPGKQHAIIIDHVGNTMRHGLPDARREWTLDRRDRRSRAGPTDVVPVRTCMNAECLGVYERIYVVCPYCGTPHTPADRSAPDRVDGDLIELDAVVLATMRGAQALVDGAPTLPYGATPEIIGAVRKRHWEKQQAQVGLRAAIALWGGWQTTVLGRDEREAQRRFFHQFGVDVGTAQTLGVREAEELSLRVGAVLARHNIVSI